MCRYALKPYKRHYACFQCRKAFKRARADKPARCPQCRLLMVDMGLDFAPPKMSDLKAWKAAAALYEVGETFHSCGCRGPGYRPRDPAKLASFFRDRLRVYRGELAGWTRDEAPARAQTRKEALAYWRARIAALERALVD